jgi:hypothetical protein
MCTSRIRSLGATRPCFPAANTWDGITVKAPIAAAPVERKLRRFIFNVLIVSFMSLVFFVDYATKIAFYLLEARQYLPYYFLRRYPNTGIRFNKKPGRGITPGLGFSYEN